MAVQLMPRWISPEEYLEAERAADERSEYLNGRIFAMAGGSPPHSYIMMNIGGDLRNNLKDKPCRVFGSDLRIKVSETGLYTYADAGVVCAEPRYDSDQKDVLLNPAVIVEVLSPSTEAYDRGNKFAHYQKIVSLTDYILVAQDRPRIEHYRRQGDEWVLRAAHGLDSSLTIDSIGCTIRLAEVYAKIEFPEPEKEAQKPSSPPA